MEPLKLETLSSKAVLQNPLEFYAKLGKEQPLTFFEFNGQRVWIVSATYEQTVTILKDPRFVRDPAHALGPDKIPATRLSPLFAQNMLSSDPPDHTRLRSLLSRSFTPKMIENLRPRIQEITDQLLDALADQDQVDLLTSFSAPLPITVISEMLGVSEKHRPVFRELTKQLLGTLSNPAKFKEGERVGDAFIALIRTIIAEKRADPSNDLISELIHVEEQSDKLSEEELISTIWLLIVAGHETTVNLLSNGVLALLTHEEQKQLLIQQPERIESAVEELLRYTLPVLVAGVRWASEDITIDEYTFKRGDMLRLSLGNAHTDAHLYPDGLDLDITRELNKHLSFGKGIHTCLGAPLARLEGQVALSTLFQRFPNLGLAVDVEQLEWQQLSNLRSMVSLPVKLR